MGIASLRAEPVAWLGPGMIGHTLSTCSPSDELDIDSVAPSAATRLRARVFAPDIALNRCVVVVPRRRIPRGRSPGPRRMPDRYLRLGLEAPDQLHAAGDTGRCRQAKPVEDRSISTMDVRVCRENAGCGHPSSRRDDCLPVESIGSGRRGSAGIHDRRVRRTRAAGTGGKRSEERYSHGGAPGPSGQVGERAHRSCPARRARGLRHSRGDDGSARLRGRHVCARRRCRREVRRVDSESPAHDAISRTSRPEPRSAFVISPLLAAVGILDVEHRRSRTSRRIRDAVPPRRPRSSAMIRLRRGADRRADVEQSCVLCGGPAALTVRCRDGACAAAAIAS